jgi:hypothetical protein
MGTPMRRLANPITAALLLLAAMGATPATALQIRVAVSNPGGGPNLAAGGTAELSWSAEPGALNGFKEWEAFLSLDGGRTYAVRLTPHLDIAVRRVTWRVPDAPTQEARLLLRFGDEIDETAVELPRSWRITDPPGFKPPRLCKVTWRRGESARPGQPGVVLWVEGGRDGGAQQAVAAEPLASVRSGFSVTDLGDMLLFLEAEEAPGSGNSPALRPAPSWLVPASRPLPAIRRVPTQRSSADLLSLLQRRNE